MFRILALIAASIFCFSSAMASEVGRLECQSGIDSPMYQLIRKDKDSFELRVYFPNGVKDAPLFSGDVTSSLLPRLKLKTEVVEKMGSGYAVQFPAKQCIRKIVKGGLFYVHCFIRHSVTINGMTFEKGLSFYSSSKKTISMQPIGADHKIYEDQVYSVGVEGGVPVATGIQQLDFATTYVNDECKANSAFWD